MSQLSVGNLPEHVPSFGYDRESVTVGIVHFGIGNFHRAHQAAYCDDLLEKGGTQWGIAGVSLRSPAMQKALKSQDYLYTLATLGVQTEYRIIGAIKDVLVAPDDPQAVVDLLAKPTTQLVSSTITEKGYCLGSSGTNFEHPALQAECLSLDRPTTIYGFLARGIIARCQADNQFSKLTIMCCDNISGGGDFLKDGVQHLLQLHNREALAWSQEHVGFVSSMVDRVCPATDDVLRDMVFQETGRQDAWPVSAEPFSQWIIEGNFAGKRPAFDQVGAIFVDDIAPFERMKLRYLNAAHTIASTLGYLNGDTFVHEALERSEVLSFMRQALYENVLPNAAVPEGYDGAAYIEDVIERFQNRNLPYANLQVGTDSSQKIQQRWFPTIDQALRKNQDCSYFEFCLGAWVVFIQTALENGVLNDPKKGMFEKVDTDDLSQMVKAYLDISNAEQYEFYCYPSFMAAIKKQAENLKTNGIRLALDEFITAREHTQAEKVT